MQEISRAVAAINILDDYLSGCPLEKALKKWFKINRFAGSSDRKNIRDLVFDILRKRLILYYPFQINEYVENGRILVLSYLYLYKKASFSLEDIKKNKYLSPAIKKEEVIILNNINKLVKKAPRNISLNYPKFLEKKLSQSLGNNFNTIMEFFMKRAPVYLRINQNKVNIKDAKIKLENEGILCEICLGSNFALKVISGEKFIKNSSSYQLGEVELQDLSSQLTTELSQISSEKKILDFCAGSGGKALAIASRLKNRADIFAYDLNHIKYKDLIYRVNKAAAKITILDTKELIKYRNFFDIIFVDAPCSGTGTWRRDPKIKWELNDQKLSEFSKNQYNIIKQSSAYLKNGGFLIYVVCSLLEDEGDLVIKKFLLRYKNFSKVKSGLFHPLNASDGFYFSVLKMIE